MEIVGYILGGLGILCFFGMAIARIGEGCGPEEKRVGERTTGGKGDDQ